MGNVAVGVVVALGFRYWASTAEEETRVGFGVVRADCK